MKLPLMKRLTLIAMAAGALGTIGVAAQAQGCYGDYDAYSPGYYAPNTYYRTFSAPVVIERPPVYVQPYPSYPNGYYRYNRPFSLGRAAKHTVNFGLGALDAIF